MKTCRLTICVVSGLVEFVDFVNYDFNLETALNEMIKFMPINIRQRIRFVHRDQLIESLGRHNVPSSLGGVARNISWSSTWFKARITTTFVDKRINIRTCYV